MQNKMLPNLRQIHSVPPFETYVKSNISKTLKTFVSRPKMIVESYVKLIPPKLFFRFFFRSSKIETYVKSHISKTCGQLSMTT